MATVAIFTFLGSWNELMFAITFISTQQMRTLTVGLQSMVGQYATQWGPIGAGLVIGTIPTIIIYSIISKQVLKFAYMMRILVHFPHSYCDFLTIMLHCSHAYPTIA